MRLKAIRFFGSTTAVAGETMAMPTNGDFPSLVHEARFMDVLVNIKTLSGGTSPSMTFSVQELFSDTYFETANSGAKTAVSKFALRNADSSGGLLGKGETKQIVVTCGGSPSAVSADVYIVFYN